MAHEEGGASLLQNLQELDAQLVGRMESSYAPPFPRFPLPWHCAYIQPSPKQGTRAQAVKNAPGASALVRRVRNGFHGVTGGGVENSSVLIISTN